MGCPTWDLATMASHAKPMGYNGIELRALGGQMNLANAPELAADPAKVVQALSDLDLELVCLSSSATFHSRDPHEVEDQKAIVREYIELAAKLSCPFVRVFGSEVPKGSGPDQTANRIANALHDLASHAAKHRVTILIENSGDFCSSKEIWYLLNIVNHPAVKACWNPLNAASIGERPTISIPRLGTRLGMVHVCDATFDEGGAIDQYVLPGKGSVELYAMIRFLVGLGYDGYIMFDWPKMWVADLAEPEAALPAAHAFIKNAIEEEQVPLSAYKGDKNAPKFAPPLPAGPEPRALTT